MKLIFIDYSTKNVVKIYHEPQYVLIKPRKGVVKIIQGNSITEYKYYFDTTEESYDHQLDVKEELRRIYIDRSSMKEYKQEE